MIGAADFTSKAKRLELLDLLGGLTPLDVEGDQTLLQGLVEEGNTIILVCPIDSAAPKGPSHFATSTNHSRNSRL